uniref:Transmembrane protein 242 n=1 Tax=Plectus sambesii TaxID=2011161 RepID=A0A914VKU7_9BILA
MAEEPKKIEHSAASSEKKGIFDNLTDFQKKTFAVIGLGAVGCVSLLSSLSGTLSQARKSDPKNFDAGIEGGVSLASRALLRATVYAVGGVGVLTFVVCKALDVHSLAEFRVKMQSMFKSRVPEIPRSQPAGRSDFKSIRELFEYLSEEDKNAKRQRQEMTEQTDK